MPFNQMIFINLPVTDLGRSIAFYAGVGARNEPKFSNESAAMMVFSETISVMLLTHPFYAGFTGKPIADAHATSQMLLCLSRESRAAVEARFTVGRNRRRPAARACGSTPGRRRPIRWRRSALTRHRGTRRR